MGHSRSSCHCCAVCAQRDRGLGCSECRGYRGNDLGAGVCCQAFGEDITLCPCGSVILSPRLRIDGELIGRRAGTMGGGGGPGAAHAAGDWAYCVRARAQRSGRAFVRL